MAFDLSTWKQSAADKLRGIGGWLDRRKTQDAPLLVYGTLCGLSLWPLVEAARQPGGYVAVIGALGTVAAGVGADLIAEQVQRWKDRAEPVNEAQVSRWVAEHASDADLRAALDAILERVEAVPRAQAALSAAERQWFTDTLKRELTQLGNLPRFQATLVGSGAIAQGDGAIAAGAGGVAVGGSVTGPVTTGDDNIAAGGHVIYAETGATVVIGEAPVKMMAVDRASALGRYLQHIISRNRYLQLQGIRSGGKLVNIELDQIYITLRATRQRVVEVEEAWLTAEAQLAPGELHRAHERMATTETVTVSVCEALKEHARLAVLGDPGSGKTTLLRYLALLYARDLAEGSALVRDKLELGERGRLPILLPLRQIGAFLRARPDDGTEGHKTLLDFLLRSLGNERIELPPDFFDERLNSGQAVILLDGLDEVADPDLRRRVSRLVEAFARAYPTCRYVVTSRIVGYTGAARLGEAYTTTTVRDFTLSDVESFLVNWHRLVAVGQMGPGESAEAYAAQQTQQLMNAIRGNERIRELAINPLMLTVIAMVHRDRVKLPDRRAELYAEAVDVLLGKWEEAKGLQEVSILEGKPFDTGDRRLMLQSVALAMHAKQQKEISADDLRRLLGEMFYEALGNWRQVERAVQRFLSVIEERTGLLAARGEGVYAFSHLTFQEYLAATAIAARDDYVDYSLQCAQDAWWREVILLEAGHLSLLSKEKTTRLIQAIADLKQEPLPYHNLVLAAECLRDVGSNRVQGDLEGQLQRRLRRELETLPPKGWLAPIQLRFQQGMTPDEFARRRVAAAQALARIGGTTYWTLPYGEPEWVQIPAGEFWMGTPEEDISSFLTKFGGKREWYKDETPRHKMTLPAYSISRVPITNAQYHLFVQATGHEAPEGWEEHRPPKGQESHPVVNVTWRDALVYCEWLSQATGKRVTLPSEAEWEKAARGDQDAREFPWGDAFDATRCNCRALGLGDTTPVGIFLNGASPYGVLDLSGNVWEWTQSLYKGYPYDSKDGRESLEAGTDARVLRGGAFSSDDYNVRCAVRYRLSPDGRLRNSGCRVVLSPL